jgi:hypothetical protein
MGLCVSEQRRAVNSGLRWFYDLNRIFLRFSREKIDGSDASMHLFLRLDEFQAIYRGFLRILRRSTTSDRDLSPTGIAGLVMLRS